MNRLTIAAIVCGAGILTGSQVHADSMVAPEDYIEACTAMCQRIVLIDVKAVKVKTTKIDKGIETREVTVEADRVETLRGNDKDSEFKDTSSEVRVSDMVEAKRSHPANVIDVFLRHPGPGAHPPSSCKAGHRYLVLFYGTAKFFVEVPRNSEEWRKQVKEYQG